MTISTLKILELGADFACAIEREQQLKNLNFSKIKNFHFEVLKLLKDFESLKQLKTLTHFEIERINTFYIPHLEKMLDSVSDALLPLNQLEEAVRWSTA